jgi:hypothetical protein
MSSEGWGRAGWGDGGWGEDTNQILYLSGWGRLKGWNTGVWGETEYTLAATGQVGSVSAGIVAGASVEVTGVYATGVIGEVNVQGKGEIFPSSLEATTAVGSVTVHHNDLVTVTGVAATGAVGVANPVWQTAVYPTGLAATTDLSGPTSVTGKANVSAGSLEAVSGLSGVTVELVLEVPVTGLSATTSLGSVTVFTSVIIDAVGLSATGQVGRVLVWEDINPSQNPNWINLNPSQTPGWSNLNPSQTPNWTPVP